MIGIVYGVKNLLTGRIVKVGATTRRLAQRESQGANAYCRQDWFRAEPHELIALRSVEHSDSDCFWWYLRAVETMEIVRRHTWKSEGGRNVESPLVAMAQGRGLNPLEISRQNGVRGGRPRVAMDWGKWSRLAVDGASDKTIADALGISRRTLKRRKADGLRQEESL